MVVLEDQELNYKNGVISSFSNFKTNKLTLKKCLGTVFSGC